MMAWEGAFDGDMKDLPDERSQMKDRTEDRPSSVLRQIHKRPAWAGRLTVAGKTDSAPALGALAAYSRMTQDGQPLRLDRLAAPFAATIYAHVKLFQRRFDLGEMLLSALKQGQVQLPLVDHGITGPQAVIAFGFQASVQALYFLEHLGTLGHEASARCGNAIVLGCHLESNCVIGVSKRQKQGGFWRLSVYNGQPGFRFPSVPQRAVR
jgi:hypothetical protein